MAYRWTLRADRAEEADRGREAIRCYVAALKWRPLEHALQLPPPTDEGGAPAPADQDTIPCVFCGTPIPRARRGQTGTGLYCGGCA